MNSPERPLGSGEPPPTPTTVDPRAGTRVALGFPILGAVVAVSWLTATGSAPEFSVWTFLVLPAICAAYGLFPVVLGSRILFSFEVPTIILAGLVGGPLAGVLAGVATGLGDVGAVWRRRSTYAGLAMLQGFAAGLVGQAWLSGRVSLPAAVALAGTASLAIGFVGHALVLIDRQNWPSSWLVRGTALELTEVVVSGPFLVLLAGNFAQSPGLVSLAAASALGLLAVGTWTLTSERSPVETERYAQLLDPLTGALSRVAFEAALASEQERVLRGERSAGLLVCDLDHFGRFNERHGHLGGDRALRFAVEQIQAAARASDVVARWGGEEICLITPGIGSLAELEELCERVRQSVTGASLALEDERVSLTISIGATLLTDWSSPEETFARADEALYLAKRTRDAVCVLAPKLPGGERTAWALAGA
jgi:diguanylate cyclase (GGDEF)-like protein